MASGPLTLDRRARRVYLNDAELTLRPKALALLEGRYAVQASDIRTVAQPVLRHRIFTNFNADAEGVDAEDIINELIKTVPEPSEADYAAAS